MRARLKALLTFCVVWYARKDWDWFEQDSEQ